MALCHASPFSAAPQPAPPAAAFPLLQVSLGLRSHCKAPTYGSWDSGFVPTGCSRNLASIRAAKGLALEMKDRGKLKLLLREIQEDN